MKINKWGVLFSTTLSVFALVSCSSTYTQANVNYDQTKKTIHQKEAAAQSTLPPVVMKAGYYIDKKPISLDKPPAWLLRRISLRANTIPFSMLMTRLLRNTNMNVTYDKTVQPSQSVSLNYTGTIKGALNTLAQQTNDNYTLTKDAVHWSAFVTKTFDISFMPGASTYLVGRTQNSKQNSTQSYGAGTHISRIDDQQYSNLTGRLSVWRDLRNTMNELKSKDGQVIISESTTTVTVHDHPENVASMTRYIGHLNTTLSQQVAIRVQVLDIELSKDFNYGIDWNLVAHMVHHDVPDLALMGNLSKATNLVASNIIDRGGNSAVASFRIGDEGGSNALINALSKQGKLRVVTKPEVVTMNNQIASIRITQDTGYLESVNQSYAENYVTTAITPGTVTDGFTLYILPKIQGQKVYMQISSTISNLVRLDKQSTIPTGVTASTTSNNQYNAIEVPTLAEKVFNQRSMVVSGSTLIIAGYKRLRDEAVSAKLFGSDALGGKGAQTKNIETLVLITPTILRSQS